MVYEQNKTSNNKELIQYIYQNNNKVNSSVHKEKIIICILAKQTQHLENHIIKI